MLITGASQGIGRALAQAAARRGARLVLVARSQHLEELAQQLRQHGVEVEAVRGDITRPEDRQRMIDAAVSRFGGLDILVNNAGLGATGHFCDATEDRLRQIMEVNFFALAELIRIAIPVLEQGHLPVIVNISSAAGKRALPSRSEYSASKYAVQGFSDALRAELVRQDIDVIVVCPGLTRTDFPKHMIENKARVPLDHLRAMSPEQVAEATLRAIERGKDEIVLTWQAKLLALFSRLFPRFVNRMMARKVRQLYRDDIEARRRRRQEKAEVVSTS